MVMLILLRKIIWLLFARFEPKFRGNFRLKVKDDLLGGTFLRPPLSTTWRAQYLVLSLPSPKMKRRHLSRMQARPASANNTCNGQYSSRIKVLSKFLHINSVSVSCQLNPASVFLVQPIQLPTHYANFIYYHNHSSYHYKQSFTLYFSRGFLYHYANNFIPTTFWRGRIFNMFL